ncbi:hypothetical protein GMMP1_1570008 [Candidatus Magnetomoraceae bacterium gMMP-1]
MRAKAISEKYLRLYPYRSKDGLLPDRVCVPTLRFILGMKKLKRFIESQNIHSTQFDDLIIHDVPVVREKAIEILNVWSGSHNGLTHNP